MAEETFAVYHGTRATATVPPGPEDLVLIKQGDSINTIRQADLIKEPTTMVDCSSGPRTVLLPESGRVRYFREDATANAMTIAPSIAGQTVQRQTSIVGPDLQDGYIILELIGTDWKQVG